MIYGVFLPISRARACARTQLDKPSLYVREGGLCGVKVVSMWCLCGFYVGSMWGQNPCSGESLFVMRFAGF